LLFDFSDLNILLKSKAVPPHFCTTKWRILSKTHAIMALLHYFICNNAMKNGKGIPILIGRRPLDGAVR